MRIRPMEWIDLEPLRHFADAEIGTGYYSKKELKTIFERSKKNGIMCSLVLEDTAGRLLGMRISYPAGQWEHGKGFGLKPEAWTYPISETAYFQSIFLSEQMQGQCWGGKISRQSLHLLRETGARGVVCHSWKESPHDSSSRYLQKLGFSLIAEHPRYWKDLSYNCSRCLKPPCECTAQEMYLDLEKNYEHIVLA